LIVTDGVPRVYSHEEVASMLAEDEADGETLPEGALKLQGEFL
jgi:hypothetical protein